MSELTITHHHEYFLAFLRAATHEISAFHENVDHIINPLILPSGISIYGLDDVPITYKKIIFKLDDKLLDFILLQFSELNS